MTGRKVFSLIGLILSVLLIVCLFLPFYDYGTGTYSLWEYLGKARAEGTRIIIMIELIIAALSFLLQMLGVFKDSKLAYLGLGYYFTYHLSMFCSAAGNDAFNELSWGYWIGFILVTITVIITIIGNCMSNEKKERIASYGQPVGFDPKTGKPIYEQAKQIVGYDPQTGKPIYK